VNRTARHRFADIEVDVGSRAVLRQGHPVPLQKKPLDLLLFLLEHRDRAVSKDEILRSVWPDEHVSESSLAVCVTKLRKALGGGSGGAEAIATLHGFGYRFVGSIEGDPGAAEEEVANPNAPPLVGRGAELSHIRAAWRRAAAGERQVVLLSGEGGIGKSALVDEILADDELQPERVSILRADCLDLRGGHEPYLPLLDAWSGLCRSPQGRLAVDILRRCAPGWLLQLHGFVDAEERARLTESARGVSPERAQGMLARALRELADLRPVLLVAEDLHWADPATLDLLLRVARDRTPAPLLLLGTFRPEFGAAGHRSLFDFVAQLRRGPQCTELPLSPLASGCIADLIRSSAVRVEPTPQLCSALHERTGGRPLLLAAALRQLDSGGSLDAVPPEIHATLELEFEAIPATDQRDLEAAAAVGAEFTSVLVAAALDAPLADTEERLLAAARKQRIIEASDRIVWPDGTVARRFRFRHPYYVDVALDRAAAARQRQWHMRIGARLESGFAAGLPGTIALRIARHFENAGDPLAALGAYERAVAVARVEGSHERVEVAATTALRLLESMPHAAERDEREMGLRMILGGALVALRGYVDPVLRTNVERVLEIARARGAAGPEYIALLTLSAIHQTMGNGPAVRSCAEVLIRTAESHLPGVPHTLARARLGQFLATEGELVAARSLLEAARGLAVDVEAMHAFGLPLWVDPEVVVRSYLASVLLLLGYPDQAQREMEAGLERADSLQHGFSAVTTHLMAAGFHLLRRDFVAAGQHSQRFVDLARRDGLMEVREDGLFHCLAQILNEVRHETVDRYAAAIENNVEGGILHMMPLLLCVLAEAQSRIGAVEKGLAVLDSAAARIAAGGEGGFLAEVHRLRGALLVAQSDKGREQAAAQAENAFTAAIDVARCQGARWFELRATTDWARLLHRQGRGSEASGPLRTTYASFTEGFEQPDLRAAAQLLSADPTARPSSHRST